MSLLAALAATATSTPLPSPTIHVFALNGQSNMWGQYGYDPELDTSNPRILVWPGSGASVGSLIEAVEPLPGLETPGYGPPPGIGPGMSFARALLATLPADHTIVLVPNAVGSTSLTGDWNPSGGSRYTAAITRTNAAIAAAGPDAGFGGFLWLQGENDAIFSTAGSTYAALLDSLIAGMRAGVTDADTAPFLVLGMVPEFAEGTAAAIRAAHAATPSRVTRTAYVPGPSGMNVGDNLHYNGAAQRILGASAHTAYAALD